MKTNERARKLLKLRYSAGLFVLLLLVPATFWMACHVGRGCVQVTAAPNVPAPAIGHWFVAQ